MSVLVANSAVERIREIMRQTGERDDMVSLQALLHRAATDPTYLSKAPGVVLLANEPAADWFAVRAGKVVALVTVDPTSPDQIIVINVNQAGDGEDAQRQGATPDLAHTR